PVLADAIGTVLRLPVVGRHPVEIVEHHLLSCGKVDPDAAGDDVSHNNAHTVVPLESVNQAGPLAAGGLAGDNYGLVTEVLRNALYRLVERAEYHHLLTLRHCALHKLDRV